MSLFGAAPLHNDADIAAAVPTSHDILLLQHSLDGLKLTDGIDLSIQQLNEHILSYAERERIKNSLLKAKTELESLEYEISRTQALLCSLLTEREQRTSRIETLTAAIAPHKHLPSEILSEIMVLSSGADDVYIPPTVRGVRAVPLPWKLARVCSRWRQIALGEPRIWSVISLYDGCTTPEFMPIAREVFRRSGQTPLSLFLFFRRPDRHPVNPVSSFIAPNLTRISTVYLSDLPSSFMTDFLSLPIALIALRKIDLSCPEPFRLPAGKIQVFEGALQLTQFRMRGRPDDMTNFPYNLNIQWRRLMTMNFTEAPISPLNAHQVLSQCYQLTSCIIEIGEGQESSTLLYPPGSIQVPFLEDLKIANFRSSESGLSFFSPLVLPAISTLTIDGSFPGGTTVLADVLHRSSSPIKEITLRSTLSYNLGPIIENVPSLQSLTASKCELQLPTIEKMARNECAPKLKQLDCGIDSEDANAFFEMLERKWEGENSLPRPERWAMSWVSLSIRGADDDLLDALYSRRDELLKRLGPRAVSMW